MPTIDPERDTTQQADAVKVATLLAGSGTKVLPKLDLIGANAAKVRYVHTGAPVRVTSIAVALTGSLDADGSIAITIEGNPIDGSPLALPSLGSADGEVITGTYSARLESGQRLGLTVGGTNTTATFGDVTLGTEPVLEY